MKNLIRRLLVPGLLSLVFGLFFPGCASTIIKIDGDKIDITRRTLLTDQTLGPLTAELGTDKSITVGGAKTNQTKGGAAALDAAGTLTKKSLVPGL